MGKGTKLIIILAAVLALCLIGFCVFLGIRTYNSKVYTEKMTIGDRYYSEGDYLSAVAAYVEAIRLNPSQEGGYISLARTYSTQGLDMMAMNTLQQGLDRAGSTEGIRLMLSSFINGGDGPKKGGETSVNINTGLLRILGRSSSLDYTKRYGLDSIMDEGEEIVVRYNGLNADVRYRNTSDQPSAVVNGNVSSKAVPVSISFDSASTLLGISLPVTFAQLQEAGLSQLEISRFDGVGPVVRFFDQDCEILIASDEEGNISEGAWNQVVPKLTETIPRPAGGSEDEGASKALVKVDGTIIDAATAEPVDEVLLSYYRVDDSTNTVAEAVTDGLGEYTVEIPSGDYVVRISKDGYVEDEKSLYLGEYSLEEVQDYTISRELEEGEIRIVLSWDGVPADLDSHLEGWTDAGANFHVYFENKTAYHNGRTIVSLDLDDTDGYGPETTTIYDMAGVFKFYVHDYRRTGLMEESGATVTVYLPGESPIVYTLSDGTIDGYYWNVFTIDHGNISVD